MNSLILGEREKTKKAMSILTIVFTSIEWESTEQLHKDS